MPIVYVLSNPVMPGLVKIGCSSIDDASVRISQLYTSGVPVPFKIEFAAKVDDISAVERALHTAFEPYRINPRREFFRLDPEQPIAILRLLHLEETTTQVESEARADIDPESLEAEANEQTRRPRFDFEEMGIPVGAVLRSARNDTTALVVPGNKVRLGDQEMSLSAATRLMANISYQVAPGPFWRYEGRLLRDIYNETYAEY